MTVKHLFPDSKPALDLNFARSRSLDPRISFARASTGTYVNKAGIVTTALENEPRFEYDYVTGKSLGLLVEEARTNLYPNSVDGATAATSDSTIKVSNFETAAGLSMNKFEVNTGENSCQANLSLTASAAGWHTFSLYFKFPNIDRQFRVACSDFSVGSRSIVFDTSTLEVVSTNNLNPDEYVIKELADNVVRVSISLEITAADLNGQARAVSNDPWTPGEYFLVAGYQFEEGQFPTSYIETTAPIGGGVCNCRAADVAQITGTNFSDWYNQSEGTLLFDFIQQTRSGVQFCCPASIKSSNGDNNSWGAWTYTGGSQLRVPVAGQRKPNESVNLGDDPYDTIDIGKSYKVAVAHSDNNFSAMLEGYEVRSRIITPISGMILLRFGLVRPNQYYTGTIARLTYYRRRLSDEQLVALTA